MRTSPRSRLINRILVGVCSFLPFGNNNNKRNEIMDGYSWFRSHGAKTRLCVCAGRTCLLSMMLVSPGYSVMITQTRPGVFLKATAPGPDHFVEAHTHFSQIRDNISSIQLNNSSCNRCFHPLVNEGFSLQPQQFECVYTPTTLSVFADVSHARACITCHFNPPTSSWTSRMKISESFHSFALSKKVC